MKIIITCGPSFEPIDQVRRLTNFSTGELGVQLSTTLARAGFEVFCLKGSGATHPDPAAPCQVRPFDTNDDLLARLRELAAAPDIAAVCHVAALCDYKVQRVADEQGRNCDSPKIASRAGTLTLTLEPATKVIAQMRGLFPHSILIGWKYELAGTRPEALAKAARQLAENHTDACVVNGQAFGPSFGFCQTAKPIHELGSKAEVARFLTGWLRERLQGKTGS